MSSISDALRHAMVREYVATTRSQPMHEASEIAPGGTPADHVRLGLLQLLLPELVAAVEQVIVESADNDAARRMAGGLLTYVCNPLDIIGDDTPLGRVDDAIICALGLKRLRTKHGIDLGERTLAVCDVAIESFAHLSEELQNGIEDFVDELEASTNTQRRRA